MTVKTSQPARGRGGGRAGGEAFFANLQSFLIKHWPITPHNQSGFPPNWINFLSAAKES